MMSNHGYGTPPFFPNKPNRHYLPSKPSHSPTQLSTPDNSDVPGPDASQDTVKFVSPPAVAYPSLHVTSVVSVVALVMSLMLLLGTVSAGQSTAETRHHSNRCCLVTTGHGWNLVFDNERTGPATLINPQGQLLRTALRPRASRAFHCAMKR